jgi:adenylate cyclase
MVQLKRLALGLVIGLLGILASLLLAGTSLEEDVDLYWLFLIRGAVPSPSDVVVVAINQQSAQQLGLSNKPSEWPRSLHADLVQHMVSAGAQVVTFDLTFDTESHLPEYDQELAEAMAEAKNVVLVETLKKETVPLSSEPGTANENMSIERSILPIAVLERAALAHAPFPLPKVSRVNAYWTFKAGAGDTPTLPVTAFQIYALQAYDEFLGLWRKAAPLAPVKLPASREAIVTSDAIPALILTLRNALLNNPQIGERMLSELENATDQDVDPRKKRIIRSLLRMYMGADERYFNFYGPPRTVATVPYFQALQAQSTPDSEGNDFKGKAVFVGFSAFSQSEQDRIRDDYRTVFSQANGLDISGVEIAATAFGNLLEDRAVTRIAAPWQLGFVILWGVALGTVCRMLRPSRAGMVVAVLISIYSYLAFRLFAVANLWLPLLIPLALQAPLALFGGALLNYRDARRERVLIKQAFGYFLPEGVVDQLIQSVGPISSTNQVVHGACLATDAEQYTRLAEKMEPAALGQLMNDYYQTLFEPVERQGGVVSDVVGDAMLAIWAAASSDISLRRRACEAALDMTKAVEEFNRQGERAPLPTRIGLHSGQMLLGSIGAVHHYEYRAVGDIVNTATRIQGLNKVLSTHLLASEAALEGLEEFLSRPLGSFLLAGKSTPVRVFELLCRNQDAGRRQLWLSTKFTAALEAYGAEKWREAADNFAEIQQLFPDDGPSRFYLQRCQHYAASPPVGPWDATVQVEGK